MMWLRHSVELAAEPVVREHFYVRGRSSRCMPYCVHESGHAGALDCYRTRSGAEYACRLLNAGTARVDAHACIGCRVVTS